jgi:AMMECR1 domain-containing protein
VDGVILEWRGCHATFLPQVWEQLPEPADFLAALLRKAGLRADFWAEDLRLQRYRVRKFERQHALVDEAQS